MSNTTIKITIIDQYKSFNHESQLKTINLNTVIQLLSKLKNIRKNQIDFIRFKNSEKAWELLSSKTPDIEISNKEPFELLVKLIKKEIPDSNIETMITEAKSICSYIDKEISELKDPLFFKNSSSNMILNIPFSQSSSNHLSETLFKEQNFYFSENTNIDIIVLTANPLIDNDMRELRTVNDFNAITDSIYQVVSKSILPIVSQFLPLTKNSLKYSLSKKPKILHLICKSTYEGDNNVQKTYSPILLFENEKCEMEKVTRNILSKIFQFYNNNIKDITLFISTPLCEDVYNMVNANPDNKFKNLLVQHTTIACVSYLSEFNHELYRNLLEKQSLEQAFNSAKIDNISGYQFCCCYHKHEDSCSFKKNLSNELFRKDEELQTKDNKQGNSNKDKDKSKMYPHLYHLRYKCVCESRYKQNNFCFHKANDCENKNSIVSNKIRKCIFCCCTKKISAMHNIDDIFKKYTNEEKKIIFEDCKKDEYKKCVVLDYDKLPDYGKMHFKVGFNKIFYNIFEFITIKRFKILNFYGNQSSALEIDNIISILKQFIKEKYNYLLIEFQQLKVNSKEQRTDLIIRKNTGNEFLSEKFINKNKLKFINPNSSMNLDLDPSQQKSAKQLYFDTNLSRPIPSFILLDQDNLSLNLTNSNKHRKDTIYIINALKISEWNKKIEFIKDYSQTSSVPFIIFSSSEILDKKDDEDFELEGIKGIENIPMNILDDVDRMIINQIYKIEFMKKDFEELIKEKNMNIREEEIAEIKSLFHEKNKDLEMHYLILYLFSCANSGLFQFEFNSLFPDNNELKEAKNIRDLFSEKRIINEETNRNNDGGKGKSFQEYIKYIKNKFVYNKIPDIIKKIPEHIKYNVVQRLFLFYAKKFRLIIDKLRKNKNAVKYENGYEPDNTLFSFSAIQTLGIWIPLNNTNKFNDDEKAEIYNVDGYFKHLNRNLKDILNDSIVKFLSEDKKQWENARECLEDISLTLLTLYKIYNNREIEEGILAFQNYFKDYNFSKESELRFDLFIKMQSDYYKINEEKILKDLNVIEKGFSEINNKEGQLEALFASFTMSNEKEQKMRTILKEMEKDQDKKKFIDLFECKINYVLMDYKIKKKNYDRANDHEKIIKIFDEYNMKIYIIKTFILISDYYYGKIKDKKYADESTYEHLYYLNCAYLYACYDKDEAETRYVRDAAKSKYSLNHIGLDKNQVKYKEFKNKIIEIYKNCGLRTHIVEGNVINYFCYKDLI